MPVEGKGSLLLPFFPLFLVRWAEASREFRPSAVDLADTHVELKTLVECRLKPATRDMRGLLALFSEKGSYLSTEFRGMPMSPILQSRVPAGTDSTKEAIGHGSLHRHRGGSCCLLPRLTCKHRRDETFSGSLPFGLLHLHPFLSARTKNREGTLYSLLCSTRGFQGMRYSS